jgi:TetR/AcrR family transcriptional regulator, cholesterol catabolism regulator
MAAPLHIDISNEWVRKILDKSDELIRQFGARALTMDLLAKELGISKKTIYQYFDNKAMLVFACVSRDLEKSQQYISAQVIESKDAVEELVNIGAYFVEQFRQMQTGIMYELEKYFSDSWQLIHEHKMGFALGVINANLERGIREGLYRKDINKDVVAKFYISKTDMIFNQRFFPYPRYKITEIYLELLKYHLHAIATPEGLDKFKLYKKKLML